MGNHPDMGDLETQFIGHVASMEPYSALRPKPTDDWCGECGKQTAATSLHESVCDGCSPLRLITQPVTTPKTVRVLATDFAALVNERVALAKQRDELQATCSRLLEEKRALDWCAQLRHMFVAFNQQQPDRPGFPDDATVKLRRKLLVEEFHETLEALDGRDLVEVTDGVIDLCVVSLGMLIAFGVDPRPFWAEVLKTNLAKVGPGSVIRSADNKVMKPANWVAPDIAGLLAEQGHRP